MSAKPKQMYEVHLSEDIGFLSIVFVLCPSSVATGR